MEIRRYTAVIESPLKTRHNDAAEEIGSVSSISHSGMRVEALIIV